MGSKYTRETLAPLVAANTSVMGVMRELGLRPIGGNYTRLSKVIARLGLDTSHFRRGSNKGPNHKGGPAKKPWQEILIHEPQRTGRVEAYKLRRALIEMGRPYVCEGCGLGPSWNGKELRLHVEHRNTDFRDNRPENIAFLCPNCHSQTPTFSGSKGYTGVTKPTYGPTPPWMRTKCSCGAIKNRRAKRCKSCYGEYRRRLAAEEKTPTKISWPPDEDLRQLVWSEPRSQLARRLGVSDSAISKRCRKRGIPAPPRGYWQKTRAGK